MKRRDFVKASGAAALAGSTLARGALSWGAAQGDKRPNVIMITCHDLGQHLGCYGVETVNSPNIDKLASKGVRFHNFFSTSAVCSPGRGSLHTGRYPQSNGLMGLTHAPWWWSLNEDERHTASLLKDIGYETYLFGMQHVTQENPKKRLGYDHASGNKVEGSINLIKDAANRDKPFFAKIGFTDVHRGFQYGEDRSKGVWVPPYLKQTEQIVQDFANYQGEIKAFDAKVGKILDALEASDIADNTIVIFTSDHGIPFPGGKWCARRAGFTVPFIVYQPGTVFTGGKVFEEIMSNVDVLPTLLTYLGAEVPKNMQGVSFMDLIAGNTDKPPREYVYGQYTPDMKRDNLSRSIMTDRYQLIRYFDQGRTVAYPVDVNTVDFAHHVARCSTRGTRPYAQLYDMKEDPYELNDIGGKKENQELVDELSKQMYKWMEEVGDQLLEGPLRTPYYDRAIADFRADAGVKQ